MFTNRMRMLSGTGKALDGAHKGSGITLSNGGLSATYAAGSGANLVFATFPFPSSGTSAFEMYDPTGNSAVGLAASACPTNEMPGNTADSWSWFSAPVTSDKYNNNVNSSYGTAWANVPSVVIGIKYKPSTNAIEFFRNGVSAGDAFSNVSGTIYAVWGALSASAASASFRFDDLAYSY